MAITTVCRHCRKRLKLPDRVAGRKVMCPRCEQVLEAPDTGISSDSELETRKQARPASSLVDASQPDPIGAMSAALGLMAILVLCIPYVGYAAFLFSAAGVIIGLWGLVHSHKGASHGQVTSAAASVSPSSWQSKGITHPLFGIGVCLFALLLGLLPRMLHELGRYH